MVNGLLHFAALMFALTFWKGFFIKTAIASFFVVLFISPLSFAAIGCPADSCNPANGCMDGCTQQQWHCGTGSDNECSGKNIYESCQVVVGESATSNISYSGSCSPASVYLPAACHCQ
ncbi:MAG: hypothetical protein H7256_00920 [Bdellovibrio sp.]|nr:hypothetical protein [Bdellovibrio sp.]